jgi:hypothetical protein
LKGDRFFYGNPLASKATHERKEWFGTACCPSNISRLVASLGDYIYAKSANRIWINLFVSSYTKIKLADNEVGVSMQTSFPLEGEVKIALNPSTQKKFALHIRIPSWAGSEPVSGNLYKYLNEHQFNIFFRVNGKKVEVKIEKGYAVIEREWTVGDEVSFSLPMEVKRVISREEVSQNKDRVALQRGALIYCVEGIDNNGKVWDFYLPDNAKFIESQQQILSETVITLQTEAITFKPTSDGQNLKSEKKKITAIPYYAWCNRGKTQMQVWLPRRIHSLRINDDE